MPMFEEMLAPPQLYVLLAITIATFGWLLRPGTLGELPSDILKLGAALVFVQYLHLGLANFSPDMPPDMPSRLNFFLHYINLSAYVLITVRLFVERWREDKGKPPDAPRAT